MKQRIQDIIIGFLVAALLFGGTMTAFSAQVTTKKNVDVYYGYDVYIDGVKFEAKDKNGTIEPFLYNGWIYAPFEHIAKSLGKTVQWNAKTNSLYITSTPDKSVTGDKAKVLSVVSDDYTEVYRNYWNKAMPFKVDDIKYEQNNIYGIKLKERVRYGNALGGINLAIDNADLDYSTVKFTVASDDFSRSYTNNNKIYVQVAGSSKALGYKVLYNSTQGRDGGTFNHEADITGFEEIYVCVYSYSEYSSYHGHSRNEDYLLLFEPTMHK